MNGIFKKLDKLKNKGGDEYITSDQYREIINNLAIIISDAIKEEWWRVNIDPEQIKNAFLD